MINSIRRITVSTFVFGLAVFVFATGLVVSRTLTTQPHPGSTPSEALYASVSTDRWLETLEPAPPEPAPLIVRVDISDPLFNTPITIPEYIPPPTEPIVVAATASYVWPIPLTPLADYKHLMTQAEQHYGLPHGIIWALAMKESGGGVHTCGYNFAGWNNCEGDDFTSWEMAIDVIAGGFAGWYAKTGNLDDALCIWQSGKWCAEKGGDNGYKERVKAFMP